jgi:two-component system, LytTR family, response regulator
MNTLFSCIIADDERPAREELSSLLAKYEGITVMAVCSNAVLAKEKIEALQPDVVFLDIDMPGKSGFDLLEELKNPPLIVFCTAYDEYALKAFEENAMDYLLKPITPERLGKTVERLQQHFIKVNGSSKKTKNLFIRDGKKIYYTSMADIFLVEANGNYVKYYFGNNTAVIRKTFREAEEELVALGFITINRHQLVNTAFITVSNKKAGRNVTIKLTNGLTLTASRSKSSGLKN